MKIFLDTAIVEEIKELNAWGVVHGVTTNPSLIAKSGRKIRPVIREIAKLIDGPVSAEVIAEETAGMVNEAKQLAKIAPNIIIKVPITPEGLKAVRILAEKGIQTNVTLVFSVSQALLAAQAGASYVSPFVGRLDDIGENGVQLVQEIMNCFKKYKFPCQVIAASVRNTEHVNALAATGVDVATIPPNIVREMINHKLTDAGIEKFLQDYASAQTT